MSIEQLAEAATGTARARSRLDTTSMRRTRGTGSHLRAHFVDRSANQGRRAECPGGFDAGLRVRPARLPARLRRGGCAPAEPRCRSIAGRDSRHGRPLRAPADVDARALERRRGAAARPRRLRAARLGDLRDRPRRPLDLARAGPARRVPDSRPARAWQGSAALRPRPRAVARARARRPGDRGDDARGPRVGRRVRAGRQDRLDRDPRAGLDRAPRLRAERRLRPLGVRPVPRVRAGGAVHLGLGRARAAVHASPRLATPSCGDSPRCSSSSSPHCPRKPPSGAARRYHGLRVRHRREPALLRRAARADAHRGRGRVLGEAATRSSCASRAERAGAGSRASSTRRPACWCASRRTPSTASSAASSREASSCSARSRTRTRAASSASSTRTGTCSS